MAQSANESLVPDSAAVDSAAVDGAAVDGTAVESATVRERRPQPRPEGLLLALVSFLLLLLISCAVLLLSQQARLFFALSAIDELLLSSQQTIAQTPHDEASWAPLIQQSNETIEQLSRFVDSYDTIDLFLRRTLSLFSIQSALFRGSDHERELVRRARDANALLSSHVASRKITIPQDILRDSLRSEAIFKATPGLNLATQAVEEVLAKLRTQYAELQEKRSETALTFENASQLQQQALLVRDQAISLFALPPLSDEEEVSTDTIFELSLPRLYREGMLAGIPVIEGIRDGLASPQDIVAAVASAGGQSLAQVGKSAEQTQQDLNALRDAGRTLAEACSSLSERKRVLDEESMRLQIAVTRSLLGLRQALLQSLQALLHARVPTKTFATSLPNLW